ncbi:LOG family protein [Aquirhabdus parva]|uniref:Cytokinin riboside 5'-monophosphate phosphoribohydrolase n=1 Tax=Aquirhabdus parva TaxID=2283318 RepID=A0A345P2M9_9GAMM|nr:TIGR00730 family Rossman fold protein [Aquirhabdus parva]AXI01538.1 TIGR00730 family Rossman fold protein [Aquirhabdus parva]
MKLKNICVYCGSNSGKNPAYVESAKQLADVLVERNIGLVYGGAQIGVMGAVANRMLEQGGRVIGVIPEGLLLKEVAHQGLTELHVTKSMHERKALMAEHSEGFIALPGGIGTFEELFEVWTWAQLGFHHKPCGLLNIAGYYDQLIAFLDHAADEGFVKPPHRELLMVEQDPAKILDRMALYTPPTTSPLAVKLDLAAT